MIGTTFTTDYHTHAHLKQTKHCTRTHKHPTLSRPNKQQLLFTDGKDNVGPRFMLDLDYGPGLGLFHGTGFIYVPTVLAGLVFML